MGFSDRRVKIHGDVISRYCVASEAVGRETVLGMKYGDTKCVMG